MLPEIDTWRAPNLLVQQHGLEAPIHAAMRADELPEKGDLDGQRVWIRIMKAVEVLLAPPSAEGPTH